MKKIIVLWSTLFFSNNIRSNYLQDQMPARLAKASFITAALAPGVYTVVTKMGNNSYSVATKWGISLGVSSSVGILTEYLKKPAVEHWIELRDRLQLSTLSLAVGGFWASVKYQSSDWWFQGWQKAGMAYIGLMCLHNRIQKL